MGKNHIYVLGLNAYDHDVSACLLRDGEIAFAINKERITRQKHDTGFYQEVVDYCLSAENISLEDVDLVVRNCYVLPVEDLETRMVSQDVPEVMDDLERVQASKNPLSCRDPTSSSPSPTIWRTPTAHLPPLPFTTALSWSSTASATTAPI
jgi:carbamoyltransferase